MTVPDSFATIADATAYGYTLPGTPAGDGLLARATQAIRDAAGIPVTETTSTLELGAYHGRIELPAPLVSSVTTVEQVTDDGNTAVTDWELLGRCILLGGTVPLWARREGRYLVTWVHGFATIPAGLVLLTCAVAYRLSATPAGAMAGLKSKTVGSVSWTAGETPGAALTESELRTLGLIVPVRRAWQVRL